jgi:hypothetical protein
VIPEAREERLSVSKYAMWKFDVKRFNVKKLKT